MGRKPNTEQRRQEIADALLKEMIAVGYERASTKSIAARAGLAPGLVHYHFGSKAEVLLALVDGLIAAAEQRHQQALTLAGTPREQLRAYITARVGLGPGADLAQVRAWLVVMAEAMSQPKVRTRVARWLSRDHVALQALFEQAGAERAAEHAAALLAAILGSFSLHALQIARVPRGYAEPTLLAWLDSVMT